MLTSLTLAFALAAPAAADDPKAVIEKAVKAHGGKELLDKFKGSRSTFKGTISAMGMDIEIKGESISLYPDKGKVKAILMVAGQEIPLVQTINGKSFKMTVAGQAAPVPDDQAEDSLSSFYEGSLAQLTPLLTADYTLKAGTEAEVDGKKAAGVVVSKDGRPDVTLYFDRESGRLVKSVRRGKGEDGADADRETFYMDYKAVSGLQVPHKEKVLTNGKTTTEMTTEKYEVLETVDASEFGND